MLCCTLIVRPDWDCQLELPTPSRRHQPLAISPVVGDDELIFKLFSREIDLVKKVLRESARTEQARIQQMSSVRMREHAREHARVSMHV